MRCIEDDGLGVKYGFFMSAALFLWRFDCFPSPPSPALWPRFFPNCFSAMAYFLIVGRRLEGGCDGVVGGWLLSCGGGQTWIRCSVPASPPAVSRVLLSLDTKN